MNMFLILYGREIDAPEPNIVEAMLRIADGSLGETAVAERLRSVMVPIEL